MSEIFEMKEKQNKTELKLPKAGLDILRYYK